MDSSILDDHFLNAVDRVQHFRAGFSWVADPTLSLSIRASMVAPKAARSLSVSLLTDYSSNHGSELTTPMRASRANAGSKTWRLCQLSSQNAAPWSSCATRKPSATAPCAECNATLTLDPAPCYLFEEFW